MCRHFGFESTRAAAKLVEQLKHKGYIERSKGAHRSIRLANTKTSLTPKGLPLLGRIAAGAPITSGEHVADTVELDPCFFTPSADLLFRVSGESMLNAGIRPGDLAGIHLQPDAHNGQIVAAVITHPLTEDAELTLKTFHRKGTTITLLSENNNQALYPPMIFDVTRDAIQIVGLYVGLLRTRP
jgi:repressor LexA